MKIVSKGFVEGYYYKPRVDKELLRKSHSGIIALSACLAGEVSRYLMKGYMTKRRKRVGVQRYLWKRSFLFRTAGSRSAIRVL